MSKKENSVDSRPGPMRNRAPVEKSKDFLGTWKKLLNYVKEYWIPIFLSLGFAALGNILMVMGPGYLSQMTDYISEGIGSVMDMNSITRLGLILLALYGVGGFLSLAQGWIMVTVTQSIAKKLRTDISNKINRLPMAYYAKNTVGDTLSRVTNDIDTVSQSLNNSVRNLVSSGTLMIGSLIMMFITNFWMTLTAVGATVIGIALMAIIMSNSQKFFKAQQNYLGTINGHIEEIYTGHTIVKSYNGEELARKEFVGTNIELRDSAFKAQSLSGLMMPIMQFIGNLGYVAVVIVGAGLAIRGSISFGVIVAFIIYVRYFTQPLSQIAQAVQSLQSAAAAGERVFEFLEEEEMEDEINKTEELADVKGHIEFSNVSFGYEADNNVINDFSVEAKPGQKIAIVGHTGAGKTTIVNLLMRFYEINAGDIFIDGHSIQSLTRENVHDLFCMVLQDTWTFEGTIRENLVYNTEGVTEEDLIAASKAVGIDHYVRTLPEGYDTILSDQANLSQGQKQQLTIARAILSDKPMLILDEATSSVDTRTEMLIQQAMDALMESRTTIVIAHRLSTIRNADLILVMDEGEIIEQGHHDELMAQDGFYTDLYNSQFDHTS